MATNDDHQFDPESESLSFPTDTVVALFDQPEQAGGAVDELLKAGVSEDAIQVLCGDAGARRLDPSGERHGLLGKIHRVIQLYADKEVAHVERQASELREGKFLVAAPAKGEDEADRVAGILKSHGGHFINHYTSMTVRALEA